MLERFTGTAERKATLATGVPLGTSFLTGQIVTADGGKTAGLRDGSPSPSKQIDPT